MEIKDISQELSKHPEGTFLDLVNFNDATVGACRISGESPVWEKHPQTDELFHLLEGTLEVRLLEAKGPRRYTVVAGSIFVVPKGVWHKLSAPNGVKFLYLTPGASLHSDLDDPRE